MKDGETEHRRRADAALEKSRLAALNLMEDALEARSRAEWLARFPDEHPSPVLRVSTTGTVLYRNRAATGVSGWGCEAGQPMPPALRPLVEQTVADGRGLVRYMGICDRTYVVTSTLLPGERYINLYSRDVTEQKLAEQREQQALALATASRTAADVLNAMGEGVAILDMEGRALSVNPALERMCGIPAGELTGRLAASLMESILAPEDRRFAREELKTALKGRVPELRTVTIMSRDGRTVKVSPLVTLVCGIANEPTMLVLTLRDISALHAAHLALEESNTVLERIFNNTYVGIVYLDREFNFIRVNPAYAAGYRTEPEFFKGKNHFEVFPDAENEAIFRRVVATGEEFNVHEKPFEFPEYPEWGVTYWDWSLRPLKGEHGKVESLLLCVLNATERVHARLNFIASERQYQELVNNANSIIIRITPDHSITFFNEFAQKFFGYAADEVLGKNVIGTIATEVDSEGRDLRRLFREITAQPEEHASNDNENMRKDGSRVWVHWSNRAVCDSQGRVAELLCVGTDITRRRELEAETQRYQQRLRELTYKLVATEEEARWRISRYIHDTIIQNLSLSNIRLGAMEKALAGAGQDAEAARLCEVRELINTACGQCRTVMSELTPALLYELGLVPALNDLAWQLEKRHGTRVRVEADGEEPPLTRPLRGMLFESARELMTNALKYAGPCEIRTVVNGTRDELVVCVADNGAGFDPAATERLSGNRSGFGLFNIRQRVEGLGGCLEIESAPGKGTRAIIRVPVVRGDG